MPRVTLIGYRGTGKSTVAAMLGDILGCGWCDADIVLEEKLGCSIASLIRDRGEPVFRDEETAVLADLLGRFPGVLSTGGGIVLRAEHRAALVDSGRPVVWLTATAGIVRQRLAADPTTAQRRPALGVPGTVATDASGDPLAEVAATLESREPLYRACADFQVDTSTATPAAVAGRIAAWLTNEWPTRACDMKRGGRPATDGRSGAAS